jgi:ABC-type sugar transport system permease subunit/ABC-type glycerol-3-phosphate transport system substrate-binding protein
MGAEGEKMSFIARAFEASHPGIKVKCQAIPWGEAHAKLITAFVGGHNPDVTQMGTTWTFEFKAMEGLLRLDDYIKRENFNSSAFFPGSWKTVTFGDGVFGLPWYVETRCLFYRIDCLEKAGFRRPPRTWQELEEMGKKLADSPGRYGILLPEKDEQILLPFIRQAGGRILDENGRPAVNDQGSERALSFYVRLFDMKIAPKGEMKDADIVQSFAEENPAFPMFISGPWMKTQLDEKAPQIKGKWAVAPLPVESRASSYLGGCHLVIFKNSKHPQAAWEFVKFASSREMQIEWFKETGDLPSRQDSWEDPALTGDPRLKAFRIQLESAEPPPSLPEWEQMADAISRRMEQAIYGQRTPGESLALLNSDLETVLAARPGHQPASSKLLKLGGTGFVLIAGLFLYFRRGYMEDRLGGMGSGGKGSYGLWLAVFLFPALSIMTIFLFLPLIASFLMSLTNYDLYSLASFKHVNVVGLTNYGKVLKDPQFWKAVYNTLLFAAIGGPLTIGAALLAALAIEKMTRMRAAYLLGFFLPVVTTLVAVAIVWKWIYHPRFGLLNALLPMLGMSPRDWLSDPRTALLSLTAMAVWKNFGNTMVILLAGLQAIPRTYYEAAEIDGAGTLSRFKEITIPLLMPTMFLVTIMTTIGYLQFFGEPYVMTGGGPVDSTLSVVLYLYRKGFKFYLLGEAAATSFVLFFIIFAFSLAQIHFGRKSEAGA